MRVLLILGSLFCLNSCMHHNDASSKLDGKSKTLKGLKISIVSPEAGVDFPTDSSSGENFYDKSILLIGETRILVEKSTSLARNHVLKTESQKSTFPLKIEKAIAGTDYPTDVFKDEFYVLTTVTKKRIAIPSIREIKLAEAGIDFPTDLAVSELPWVVIDRDENRYLHKIK